MAAGERLEHKGAAPETTLNGDINASVTAITVNSGTGYPDGSVGPFWIVIDPGLAAEEKVKCISRTANTFTVVTTPSSGRGADGTTATSHVSGAAVQHVMSADELDKLNQHINDQNDNHLTYLTTGRHDVTARHAVGTSIGAGTPGSSAVGDVAAQGVSTNAARADHTHGREAFGSPSTSAPGDTANAGSGTTVARANHTHGRESFGVTVPEPIGSTASTGTSDNVTRRDHVHNAPAFSRVVGRTSSSHVGGTPPAPATGPWREQFGTTVGTTNGSGMITVTFDTAFDNGVVSIVVSPGDLASVGVAMAVSNATVTTSGFSVECRRLDTGGVFVSNGMRIDWIAKGW